MIVPRTRWQKNRIHWGTQEPRISPLDQVTPKFKSQSQRRRAPHLHTHHTETHRRHQSNENHLAGPAHAADDPAFPGKTGREVDVRPVHAFQSLLPDAANFTR